MLTIKSIMTTLTQFESNESLTALLRKIIITLLTE